MIRTNQRLNHCSITDAHFQFPGYGWTHIHSDGIRTLALLPAIVVLLVRDYTSLLFLTLALAVAFVWHRWFFMQRNRKTGIDWVLTATVFFLLLPEGQHWWQIVMALSFGVVIGEQIFGGRGYGFIHPAIAGLAFLFYSFPSAAAPINTLLLSASLALAVIPLLYYRLLDLRVCTALLAGILMVHFIVNGSTMIALPGCTFIAALLFAACDPASGSVTCAGRWLYGLLTGSLAALFDPTLQATSAIVFACLLGSLAAPLIDWTVIYFHSYLNRRTRV